MDFDVSRIVFGQAYKLCESCGINPAIEYTWCRECDIKHHLCGTCVMKYDEGFQQDEYHPDILEDMR